MSHDLETLWQGLRSVERLDRTRLSTPGLKAFHHITDAWDLSVRDRCILLGDPSTQTYQRWMRHISANSPVTLSKDTLIRISAVLGIHKLLTTLFTDQNTAMIWLKQAHQGLVFAGRSPLTLMLNGTQDDLLTVRRYLEAWPHGTPDQVSDSLGVSAVTQQDIVFL